MPPALEAVQSATKGPTRFVTSHQKVHHAFWEAAKLQLRSIICTPTDSNTQTSALVDSLLTESSLKGREPIPNLGHLAIWYLKEAVIGGHNRALPFHLHDDDE